MDAERILQSYFSVSAAALMIFDYLITLQREVDLLWPTKWSLVKFLFVFTRYSPFVDMLLDLYYLLGPRMTAETCLATFLTSRWLLAFGITASEVILLIRTWVIWDKKKPMLVTVTVVGVTAFGCMLVSFSLWTKSLLSGTVQLQRAGCEAPIGSSIIGLSLVAVIVVEIIVIILTIIRMVQQLRDSGRHVFLSSVFRVLYRDGLLFFVYLLAISMINFIVIVAGPPMSRDLLVVFQRVLHSSLTARMLLNLREAYRECGCRAGKDGKDGKGGGLMAVA